MSAIDKLFAQLASESQTAFMPFVTAGDPDLDFTRDLLLALDEAGCHLVELGFPYSDPVADGPVIQASYCRALARGLAIDEIFNMVSTVASKIEMPIVAMASYSLIFRFGEKAFIERSIQSGIRGAIIPDLPIDESESFSQLCCSNDFDLIQLITPATADDRAVRIARQSTGFIYYVSVAGVTGERNALPGELKQRLSWLKTQTDTPVCVGFGVSEPDQAKTLSGHADGIIVGSAIVKRIALVEGDGNRANVRKEVVDFATEMIAATKR